MAKIRGCQIFLLLAIAVNLFIFLYLAQVQHTFGQQTTSVSNPDSSQADVTVLIVEFEAFKQDLVGTAQSILKVYPDMSVVIVTKEVPYPPLDLPDSDKIKIIVLDVDPGKPPVRLESFIQTKYTLVIQDGLGFMPGASISPMKSALEQANNKQVHLVVSPVSGRETVICQQLQVDLKHWTLIYSKMYHSDTVCDSVSPSSVILMKTLDLQHLAEPFIRPLEQGLFIQTVSRNWKVKILSFSLFSQDKPLIVDEHQRWKHEQKEKDRLVSLYKRFGIKKVVKMDGRVEWFGCTKNTPRCFGTVVDDMPDYIYKGRWTPPCCLRNLRETIQHVFTSLDKSGIKYWLEGGSLLGAVRNGDIIPWDYDGDIGIYRDEIYKSKYLSQALASPGRDIEDDENFVWSKAREGDFFRVQYSHLNHMHVDIFPFYERNGVMTKDTWFKTHRQDTEFPAKYLQPLTILDFAGVQASAPNNVRDFLELKFGLGVIEKPQYPDPKRLKKRPRGELNVKVGR